jgi:hypothetical protein
MRRVRHLEQEGFSVRVFEIEQLDASRARAGDTVEKPGCHLGIAGGYFIEGHVTANDIKRLLAEKPAARGIALTGSPRGLPGLKLADPPDPYAVLLYRKGGRTEVRARHNGSRPSDPETK